MVEGDRNREILRVSAKEGLSKPKEYVSRWWISSHRGELRRDYSGTSLEDYIEYMVESADESL